MAEAQDPLIGTLAAGRYRVIKPLGEGGMGQVYLAEHEAIQKRIALKVLHAEYAHKGDIVARFQQEAISASRIKHPNVLDVFDFGQLENGCFYLAMEFLEGNDLSAEIQKSRVIDPYRGLRISLQICRALAAAHGKGVVHRDMKPENVFLQRTADGEEIVKIVDFGIAQLRANEDAASAPQTKRRLTRTGMIFGTPEYMSPEQAAGKHADLRSDVYAVAIILYEMFTGAVPFTGETFLEVLNKHMTGVPPAMASVFPELQISPELQHVIMHGLEKSPDARFQSMNEFSHALLGTPEGASLGRHSLMPAPMSELGGYGHVPVGSPTAAQFQKPQTLGPAVQGSPTIQSATDSGAHSSQPTSAPRSETQAATANTVVAQKGSAAGVVIAVLGTLLVVGGGVGAFLFMKSEDARVESVPPAPASVVAAAPTVAPPPDPAPTAVVPPAPVASASATITPTSAIRLDVSSEPPGATLFKDGFQVCDSTPCEVMADPGSTLSLEARKGAQKGTVKVLAQRDQKVTIKLAGGGGGKPAGGPRMCEVEVDGLKILRPCQ